MRGNSGTIESFIALLYYSIGYVEAYLGNYKMSIENGKIALEIPRKLENHRLHLLQISRVLLLLSGCYIETLKNVENGLEYGKEGLVSLVVAFNIQHSKEFKDIMDVVKLDHGKFPVCNSVDAKQPVENYYWPIDMLNALDILGSYYNTVNQIDQCISYAKAALKVIENHYDELSNDKDDGNCWYT